LDVWYEHRDLTTQYLHPTQKPVRLAERAIKKNSEIDEIILDLFGGSGSTLIACEQLNRRCFMMELDPKYCEVIINRWEKYTNQKAIKL
jgi:DNA modification methylase